MYILGRNPPPRPLSGWFATGVEHPMSCGSAQPKRLHSKHSIGSDQQWLGTWIHNVDVEYGGAEVDAACCSSPDSF
jgi:hypothetical protein